MATIYISVVIFVVFNFLYPAINGNIYFLTTNGTTDKLLFCHPCITVTFLIFCNHSVSHQFQRWLDGRTHSLKRPCVSTNKHFYKHRLLVHTYSNTGCIQWAFYKHSDIASIQHTLFKCMVILCFYKYIVILHELSINIVISFGFLQI